MKNLTLILIIFFSFCNQKSEQKEIVKLSLEKPKIIIPDKGEFISLKSFVDWTAKHGGLKKLREFSLPKGDFEVRIWISQRIGANGLIINKTGESWTALDVDATALSSDEQMSKRPVNPKSSWQEVWKRLTEVGILSLPDSSELKNYHLDKVEDGFGYIVEINKDNIYRIYEYSNPNWADNPEAKQMVEITKIISEEFGLEDFYFDKNSGEKLKVE